MIQRRSVQSSLVASAHVGEAVPLLLFARWAAKSIKRAAQTHNN